MGNHKSLIIGIVVGALGMAVIGETKPMSLVQNNHSYEKKADKIIDILEKEYVGDIDMEEIEEGVYTGLVYGVGDKYTTYMNKENFEAFQEDANAEFVGIGIYFEVDEADNKIMVTTPIDGSPALEAGMLPGDKIIKVDGKDVNGDILEEAIAMIKGEEGTTVKLTVLRESRGETIEMDVKRAIIDVPTVKAEMLSDQVGYIKMTQFALNTDKNFEKAYEKLEKEGMKALVVDLRNNPGGMLGTVCDITDRFLPKGTIVYTVDKKGERVDEMSDEACYDIPMTVLVNGNSASASEVFSGAIKDYGRGTLVGAKTFGKGLVQRVFDLKDGSAVKVTIQRYYTPNGVCIQDIGIEPDYPVEMSEEDNTLLLRNQLPREQDKQLQKAIEVVSKEIKP